MGAFARLNVDAFRQLAGTIATVHLARIKLAPDFR